MLRAITAATLAALIGAQAEAGVGGGGLQEGDVLVTEQMAGTVLVITGGGDFTGLPRFATGLEAPAALCFGPGGDLYVGELASGEVTVITNPGDYTGAPAFATGLPMVTSLACDESQILVKSDEQIFDITAGGDFTGAMPFATLGDDGTLLRDRSGTLWAAAVNDERIVDVTAGGDFTLDPGYASGAGGNAFPGIVQRGDTLLVAGYNAGEVYDWTAGGAMLPLFAMNLPNPINMIDLGPGGLLVTTASGDVYDIAAGGDFMGAMTYATGIFPSGPSFQAFAFKGCGNGTLEVGEECDDGNFEGDDGCAACLVTLCEPAPKPGCEAATKASLKILETKPGKEKLTASLKKLAGATVLGDFGDPVSGSTVYEACVYDGSDVLAGRVQVERAGDVCGPKANDCWKQTKAGFAYKDPDQLSDGTKKIATKSGEPGKGSLSLQATNKAGTMPTGITAALAGESTARLQVVTSDGACFEGNLAASKAEADQFKAKSP